MAAPSGAADVIRESRPAAVVGRGDRLARLGDDVRGAIGPVDLPLFVMVRPTAVVEGAVRARVTGVGADFRVPQPQSSPGCRHQAVKAAETSKVELAVPLRRQAQVEINLGVAASENIEI